MKPIAVAILLLVAIVACQAATTTPPMPPLPPGFKMPVKKVRVVSTAKGAEGLTATALRSFTPASQPPTTPPAPGVMFSPNMESIPDFGRFLTASAHQGANTILNVYYRTTASGPKTLLSSFACYFVDQTFIITAPGDWPALFVVGENVACTPTFQPAGEERLGAVVDFYQRSTEIDNGVRVEKRKWVGKYAEVIGVTLPPGFRLWKKLP